MERALFEKCAYYNDHRTAATLMIDDLAPTVISETNELSPGKDHGYGQADESGLYHYFQDQLLSRYPEIKGTFFVLTEKHAKHYPGTNGYKIKHNDFSESYFEFLRSLMPQFSFAFHGTSHGKWMDNKFRQEFSYRSHEDVEELAGSIRKFESKLGSAFAGGKFPGYQSNEQSIGILKKLGFKWWAYSHSMKNKKSPLCAYKYLDSKNTLLSIPTNFSGDSFKLFLNRKGKNLRTLRAAYQKFRNLMLESHLQWLYENGYLISIQEHFSTYRTDGTFQRPNAYDDLESLTRIYNILRGSDIWHASCDEVAHYRDCYHKLVLNQGDKQLKISNNGNYQNAFISLKSSSRLRLTHKNGEKIEPHWRNGRWIYNGLNEGSYTFEEI